ncbi:TrkH family potassium uptake protein [Pseudokordiimonas caeni]|uniref:TrkH family potassium uptake protein n=1 Tax=Pseudokordiimonas caeni TaxID=2997908 RepID=UPI002811367D|nr:TrkH family potassium uptake protein [Pseudokordiimonas caeni]
MFSARYNPVIHVIGLLLMGLAFFMFIPFFVNVGAEGDLLIGFEVSAAATGFAGLLMILATRGEGTQILDLRQGFLLTSLAWLLLPAFAALPFLQFGLDYADAYFEAVSGITTTGSTVMSGLDTLPTGILLWRAFLNWLGGIGIIVMAIILLPFLRIGGMQLFKTESSDQSEKIIPKAAEMVNWITGAYTGLTILCALLYYIGGMTGFDAICHAMSTLATGGFANYDASFGHFTNPFIHWVAIFFMIAGALPFNAWIRLMRGDRKAFFRDPQIMALMRFFLITVSIMALWLSIKTHMPLVDAIRLTAFNIVSVVTTTGFATTDYTLWGEAAIGAFFLLTFVGGCAGSTSGGIKVYRFQILWVAMTGQMKKLMSPHRTVVMLYQGRRLPEALLISVLAFLAAYFASTAAVTLALTFMGLDLVTALTAAATAISNVGPGLGQIIGPAGNFASLPDGAKWLLSFTMILGRLEIFTLFLLFDPYFWKD